ncbi:MAG: SufE family protein [Kiloniellaceae bacterium]
MALRLTNTLIRTTEPFSPAHPDQVLATSPAFIDGIGLAEHLSPHRANGLSFMLAGIRTFAMAHVSGNLAGGGA